MVTENGSRKRLIFRVLKQIIDLYSNYSSNVVQKIRIAIQTMRSLENHSAKLQVYVIAMLIRILTGLFKQ